MAMEDLLRIAERTEDLPDQALAQIAASGGGIESVIAASEMKARNDIRQDAQMMQQQAQPPVVDQLINMAMRQPMPPMGAPMPPQMQQPMGQPMPPQMGMQQPMPQPAPQPTPPQMAPDMAQLAQQMGVPAMNTGGLIRRFQTGTQGTIGGGQLDAFLAQQQLEDAGFTTEQFEGLTNDERIRVMQQIEDRKALVDVGAMAMTPVAALADAALFLPRQAESELSSLANTRLGKALGFSGPLDTQTSRQPFDASQQKLQDFRQLLRPTTLPRFESALGISQAPDGTPVVTPSTTQTEGQSAPFGLVPVDNQSVDSSAGPAADEQTDNKEPPLRGLTGNQMLSLSYQGPEFLQGSSPTGLDPRLGAFTTGSGPASSTTSKVTRNLNDELMQGLIDKVNAYDTTIDDATTKMKTLEADLPTRENIKDRIKEQTRLGMAKSFFDAAGSGSPDFLTALAQGMGGAAGVMNKMTGEEQKELHQHALQMFQLEREKANTANARQEKALTRLQAARQYEQTRQIADRDNYVKLLQFQRDYNKDQFEINKANADYRESFRDALAQSQKDFDTQTNLHTNTDQQFLADADQLDMKIAVDSFGRRGVPAAQRLERKAVKTLIQDMNAEAEKLTDEQRQLPIAQQEGIIAANLKSRYEEDKLVGLEAALDQHGKYLRSVFGSRGTDRYDSAVERYLQEFPHLNSNLFTENVAPIY